MRDTHVIDLFCGIGGLTHGFTKEGFKVTAGLDSDGACRYAYEHNNHALFLEKKIEEVTPLEILELYPKDGIKILVGCAPCQPFSRYTQKKPTGDKWKLLTFFAEIIKEIQPDIVSMENVPDLIRFADGRVYKAFIDTLNDLQYNVSENIVYCPDYGIPQKRSRLVFLASKLGPIGIIKPTHSSKTYVTVRETISNLEPIAAGQISQNDPLHRAAGLSQTNLSRIRQSIPGGNWKDWVDDLLTECHKKATGNGYRSVYGRMQWDEPSPTITTQSYGYGSGRFGHPEQDRAISLREAALLQTFPIDYKFIKSGEKVYLKTIGRQIGNAVPVDLARVIARSIKNHLEVHHGETN